MAPVAVGGYAACADRGGRGFHRVGLGFFSDPWESTPFCADRLRADAGGEYPLDGPAKRSEMRSGKAGWPKEPIEERECSGCNGTGVIAIVQPKELGRRIFPPRCAKCDGKGRVPVK